MDENETKKIINNIIDTIYKDLGENLLIPNNKLDELYKKWKSIVTKEFDKEIYTGHFDGSSKPNPGAMRIGGYIKNSSGIIHEYSIGLGQGTNNEAEYKAFLKILSDAERLGITKIKIYGDSALVVNQVTGKWKCNDSRMQQFKDQAQMIMSRFEFIEVHHVPRKQNSRADKLTR